MTDTVIVAGEAYALVIERDGPPKQIVLQGQQGPAGTPGEPGPAGGSAVQRIAGETLSSLRVVYEQDGQVLSLDNSDTDHIYQLLGVTLSAATAGSQINVQTMGSIDDSGWAWTPGPIYLGAGGAITQTPATDGHLVFLGAATSATRINLNINEPIDLGME